MIRWFSLITLFCCFGSAAQNVQNKVLAGRTTGEWPYLEYGLGEDRLGGAKIGYLDSNILVRVVDSTINNYKVQLSRDHFAYLQKSSFQKDSSLRIQPYYLTNSWIVNGDEKYDYVTINLDERLPYRSIQQINPSRIVVDIFGATSNTNWITQRSSAKEIKNIYHEQPEDDVFRVIIELMHPQHWGHSIYYKDKKLVIKVKRQPADLDLENIKVAVDAGHGGSNNGAGGVSSRIAEKDYTLRIAKELQHELLDEHATVL
jgi:N-acetylmuramoyl-L-alanine amidase